MWRLGSQCMIGTGLPEPSLSINSSSHPPWQACPFPIQCCLLLLGNWVLVWVPALWRFSPSLLVGHTVGAFFGYHTLSEILSSLSSRSLRKKVDGHSILNPCSTSRMPRGSLTARQRFPEHSELLLPPPPQHDGLLESHLTRGHSPFSIFPKRLSTCTGCLFQADTGLYISRGLAWKGN